MNLRFVSAQRSCKFCEEIKWAKNKKIAHEKNNPWILSADSIQKKNKNKIDHIFFAY